MFSKYNIFMLCIVAVKKIEEIIVRESNQNNVNNSAQKFLNSKASQNNRQMVSPPDSHNNLLTEKIMVGLDHAPIAFDLKSHVIGVAGANLNYIRNETGAMATLRGKGSGFVESHLGYESTESMHLFLEHTNFQGLLAAKQLAKNLIETIQQELVQFQQVNPPAVANIQITTGQPTIFQQQIPPQTQQINISQSLLAVPPPTIIQPNGIIQQPPPQTILQPQSFIQQNPQTIVPIQIHHQAGTNMVIQQTAAPDGQQTTIGNLNIPPPSIPMAVKGGQLVQIHSTANLSHPPPNIQIQQQAPTQHLQPTQVLLNQAPPNYQLQYVQQAAPIQNIQNPVDPSQAQQVTIQHIYQTPQQIHGIVQQATPGATIQPHFEHIQVRPGQQIQTTQQFITLPGNTAYMMPPPNIIQQHQPRPQIQNFIYSTPQPAQIQYSMAPAAQATPGTEIASGANQFVTVAAGGVGQAHQALTNTSASNTNSLVKEEKLDDPVGIKTDGGIKGSTFTIIRFRIHY